MHLTVRVLTRTYLILTLSKIKVILCETSSMFLILFRFGVIITGRSSSFGSISFNTLATCFSCWTMLLILSPQTFIMLPWICLTSSLHWSQSLVFDGACCLPAFSFFCICATVGSFIWRYMYWNFWRCFYWTWLFNFWLKIRNGLQNFKVKIKVGGIPVLSW